MDNIDIHPLTSNPTAAWQELSQHQKVIKINAKTPTTEAPENKVRLGLPMYKCKVNNCFFIHKNCILQLRVVCMSDSHSLTPYIKFDIPPGDIFIHAGDFTKCGSLQEVIEFNNWIGG